MEYNTYSASRSLDIPAKINLGLNVINRRPDGYHDLETVFFPVYDFCDKLTVTRTEDSSSGCHLSIQGLPIQGDTADNLICRAYRLLDEEFHLPPVDIVLEKNIPTQAGMGGGSADCAATIRLLNSLFNLQLSIPQMQQRAAQLGADCAFFINPTPSYATGVGEKLVPIYLNLSAYRIEIIKPDVCVSTREAFHGITPRKPLRNCRDTVMTCPIEEWSKCLKNDFEDTIFPLHPELEVLKQQFYERGALYAAMSGSGSAIFGIFRK